MPISDGGRGLVALVCASMLAGCLPPPELAQRGAFAPQPVRALRVSQDDIVVAGPPGYCVDRATARDLLEGAFVMLGRCAVLDGEVVNSGAAVLTATVSPPSELPQRPDGAQLERFFRTQQGQAALARDGFAGSVTLLTLNSADDVLYMRVRDTSAGQPDGLNNVSWRAVFALKGRLVSLSAGHHADLPVSDSDLRRTLNRFVAAIRAANPDPSAEDET